MSLAMYSQNPGYRTVKQFISAIKCRRKAGQQPKPMYFCRTEISIGKAKNASGSAYVALFRIHGDFEPNFLNELAGSISEIANLNGSDLGRAEAAEEAGERWEDDNSF